MPDESSLHPPDEELKQRGEQFAERARQLLEKIKEVEAGVTHDALASLSYFLQSQACYAELNRREATKLACVIGERCGNVDSRAPVSTGDGEEHRRDLAEHGPSLSQMADGAPLRGLPELISSGGGAPAGALFLCILDSSAAS